MNLDSHVSRKRDLTFCGVGFSGLLVALGIFQQLHTRVGWLLDASKVVGAETALLNHFLWDDRWPSGITPKARVLPGPGDCSGFTLITGEQYR